MGRKADMVARLSRVQGQVRGLAAMVEDEREVAEILTLLSSIRASLDNMGSLLLAHQVEEVLNGAPDETLTRDQVAERVEKVRKALARYVS